MEMTVPMFNFTYRNPTELVFGRDSIARLSVLVPAGVRVMMTYGGGSIYHNGVYDQVKEALQGWPLVEFGGIEPNPHYETCMKAVEQVRAQNVQFLLAVGGGSVLDGTKFIAAASVFSGGDPWAIFSDWSLVPACPLPVGCVLTLPATGSESNGGAVVTRAETQDKLFFSAPQSFPRFAILDPETTYSLPPRQTANGIVDTFIHAAEQYLTYPADAPLQDRQAESLLLTLLEEGPKALRRPKDYAVRANLMWCATQALSGLIGCGVPQDWATHMIGHELTALYGIDHGQSLAVVLPGVLRHEKDRKRAKLLQMAERVWQRRDSDEDVRIEQTIDQIERFFQSLGVATRLSDYQIPPSAAQKVAQRLADRGMKLGEHGDLGPQAVREILESRQ